MGYLPVGYYPLFHFRDREDQSLFDYLKEHFSVSTYLC